MRQTRAAYHRGIQYVNKYRVDIINERFAEALISNDSRNFLARGKHASLKRVMLESYRRFLIS
jgi:hypothetical protein